MNHLATNRSNNRIEQMNSLLAALQPTKIEIIDDSHKHAGHVGARSGGGHYHLLIVSTQFESKPTVTRHRMIYSALGDMMKHDIHALAIAAYTPEEL
ncbi:MAG: transcriptional regulator, BolA protein family [Candidatus Nitrotoga sp. SPKER]|nr:MAG: transcriptional regulator, BolA protein family [Candidatus Nitrotoga sp. SPKER]